MKYKVLFAIMLLIISGCGRSVIKYASQLDKNPYQMFGRIPSREFYVPIEVSDSLNLIWESEAYGSFPNSSVSIYDELVFINDLAGRVFCYRLEDGKEITPSSRNYLINRKEFDLDKKRIIEFCDLAVKFFQNV